MRRAGTSAIFNLAAAAVIVAGSAGVAMAEGQPSGAQADQQQFKGPPNANGYSKDQSGRSAAEPQGSSAESPTNMKGPPNANGYQK